MNFKLDEEEEKKYKEFEEKCKASLLRMQFSTYGNPEHAEHKKYKHLTLDWTQAYTGAIGGIITICLTPTSLGTIIKLKCKAVDEELDITSYRNW